MRALIDRFFGLVFFLLLGFFLTWAATGHLMAGALGAVLFALVYHLLLRCWQTGPGRQRADRRQRARAARHLVARWSEHPNEQDLRSRLDARYGPGDYALCIVPLHRLGPPLTASQVLQAYRQHEGKDRLLVCVTGPVSPQARTAAQSLKNPQIRLMDSVALEKVAAFGSLPLPDPEEKRRKPFALPLPGRRRVPAILCYDAVMLGAYLLTGMPLYLIFALFLSATGLLALKKGEAPESLW